MQDPTPIAIHPRASAADASPEPLGLQTKPKLKKLRLALVVLGLSIIALVSTVFGMMMAVAGDLPALENSAEYRASKNSVLLADDHKGYKHEGTVVAKLTGNRNRILLSESEISPNIKNAVIAIEDKRFYEHSGVDYQGIGRALWQDVTQQRSAQGASTITQQFVKNALAAQGNRSIFQKLKEAALAYHLERRWSKGKILTQYLNTIYFGNGAYGIEAAVRTYFHGGTSPTNAHLATDVTPAQAAMLAALISSPAAYDPVEHPVHARERRDLVLKDMLQQGMITRAQYQDSLNQVIPAPQNVNPPRPDSNVPYFSSWVTQQLVDRYGAGRVFGGGLKIRTTLDPELQQAAQSAVAQLQGAGPTASLVAIDNKTGKIRAMVGGPDYVHKPFNIATEGHRQPGSSFKPFTLVTALENGIGPYSTWESKQKIFPVPHSKDPNEKFIVNNYEDSYSGVTSLTEATAESDNSVFAEVGLKVGVNKIKHVAKRMGLSTPPSTNPAMTLGGLKEGVTPLEMAYAYSTIANGGKRSYNTLAPSKRSPVAIEEVRAQNGDRIDEDKSRSTRIIPGPVAAQATSMLQGVIDHGTGRSAQIGEFAAGKTGTTENYGDAWFIGFNKELTVAVWVGYPDSLKPMKTEYNGGPVAGGTFPADIWRTFMEQWISIRDRRATERGQKNEDKANQLGISGGHTDSGTGTGSNYTDTTDGGQGGSSNGTSGGSSGGDGGGGNSSPSAPESPPQPSQPSAPSTPAPSTGGGGGGGGGSSGGGATPGAGQ